MKKEQELLVAVKQHDVTAVNKLVNKIKKSTGRTRSKSSSPHRLSYQDESGMTALHHGALSGNVQILSMLISCADDIDVKDNKGWRPLHYSAWCGTKERCQLLLDAGSQVNLPANDTNDTPLHIASQHGHSAVVDCLMISNADPTTMNKQGRTPLDLACQYGKVQVAHILLNSSACSSLLDCDMDIENTNYSTPLHLAAKSGHIDIIRILLQHGMDINRETMTGTCLHEASLYGKTEVVKFLIDNGADVHKVNTKDLTALDIVNKFTSNRASMEIKQHLKQASDTSGPVRAKVIKEYSNPDSKNSLTLKPGDYVLVLEQCVDGHWKGMRDSSCNNDNNNQQEDVGYFPASCVQLLGMAVGAPIIPPTTTTTTTTTIASTELDSTLRRIPKPTDLPLLGGAMSRSKSPGLMSPTASIGITATSPGYLSGQHRVFPPPINSPLTHDPHPELHQVLVDVEASNSLGFPQIVANRHAGATVCNLTSVNAADYQEIESWLRTYMLQEYTANFAECGYDILTIQHMTPEDLRAIGVSNPDHRQKLTSVIHNMSIVQFAPSEKPETVYDWLQILGLLQYHAILVNNGYDTMDFVTNINWEELQEIGITKLGHQKKLLVAVHKLIQYQKYLLNNAPFTVDDVKINCKPPARNSVDSLSLETERSLEQMHRMSDDTGSFLGSPHTLPRSLGSIKGLEIPERHNIGHSIHDGSDMPCMSPFGNFTTNTWQTDRRRKSDECLLDRSSPTMMNKCNAIYNVSATLRHPRQIHNMIERNSTGSSLSDTSLEVDGVSVRSHRSSITSVNSDSSVDTVIRNTRVKLDPSDPAFRKAYNSGSSGISSDQSAESSVSPTPVKNTQRLSDSSSGRSSMSSSASGRSCENLTTADDVLKHTHTPTVGGQQRNSTASDKSVDSLESDQYVDEIEDVTGTVKRRWRKKVTLVDVPERCNTPPIVYTDGSPRFNTLRHTDTPLNTTVATRRGILINNTHTPDTDTAIHSPYSHNTHRTYKHNNVQKPLPPLPVTQSDGCHTGDRTESKLKELEIRYDEYDPSVSPSTQRTQTGTADLQSSNSVTRSLSFNTTTSTTPDTGTNISRFNSFRKSSPQTERLVSDTPHLISNQASSSSLSNSSEDELPPPPPPLSLEMGYDAFSKHVNNNNNNSGGTGFNIGQTNRHISQEHRGLSDSDQHLPLPPMPLAHDTMCDIRHSDGSTSDGTLTPSSPVKGSASSLQTSSCSPLSSQSSSPRSSSSTLTPRSSGYSTSPRTSLSAGITTSSSPKGSDDNLPPELPPKPKQSPDKTTQIPPPLPKKGIVVVNRESRITPRFYKL